MSEIFEENEIEESTVEDTVPFLVEDESDEDKVCMTCAKYKSGTKICGIFKPYRDFMKIHGHNDVETTFKCSEYKSES